MRSHVSVFKITTALVLIWTLGACATKEKEKNREYMGSTQARPKSSGLSSASEDLRQSTKFTTLSQNIRFSVGSTQLSPSSRRALNEIANEIKKSENSFEKIRIAGLADPTGDAQRNQRLSQARAERVRNYLISRGVPEGKLEAVGKGPVSSDSMASAIQNARDRRVDFEIVE